MRLPEVLSAQVEADDRNRRPVSAFTYELPERVPASTYINEKASITVIAEGTDFRISANPLDVCGRRAAAALIHNDKALHNPLRRKNRLVLRFSLVDAR
jgi:hypothetical protein